MLSVISMIFKLTVTGIKSVIKWVTITCHGVGRKQTQMQAVQGHVPNLVNQGQRVQILENRNIRDKTEMR